MSRIAGRPSASVPTDGSRTITLRDSQPIEDDSVPSGDEGAVGTLHLRGAQRTRPRHRPRVVWRDDVVDNEHLGKKSSKSEWRLHALVIFLIVRNDANTGGLLVCCIYNRPKQFDESSDEDSSDSDEDDSSSCGHNHSHSHRHGESSPHPRSSEPNPAGQGSSSLSRPSESTTHTLWEDEGGPNSYERAPGRKSDKGKAPAQKQGE